MGGGKERREGDREGEGMGAEMGEGMGECFKHVIPIVMNVSH